MMSIAKSETFRNCTILNKALLFLIKIVNVELKLGEFDSVFEEEYLPEQLSQKQWS